VLPSEKRKNSKHHLLSVIPSSLVTFEACSRIEKVIATAVDSNVLSNWKTILGKICSSVGSEERKVQAIQYIRK